MKTIISKMKNTLEGINSRLDEAEDQIEQQGRKNTPRQSSKNKKRMFKKWGEFKKHFRQHEA